MIEAVFLLCAVLSIVCAWALMRGYRKTGNRLLLWSGLSFAVSGAHGIFLCIDLILLPNVDLHGPLWRSVASALAGALLLFGLILEMA